MAKTANEEMILKPNMETCIYSSKIDIVLLESINNWLEEKG